MMQAADLRNGHDLILCRRFDFTRDGRVPIKGQLCPGAVVIVKEIGENPLQVNFAENNHVLKALAPNQSDHSLSAKTVPRSCRRGT
jgi:hypothetical protein